MTDQLLIQGAELLDGTGPPPRRAEVLVSGGRSLAQIGAVRGTEPFDALVHVLVNEQLKVSMIVHSLQEDNLALAMSHEKTMIGSDGRYLGRRAGQRLVPAA
jgi:N-acyl-D-aspartate/D-glutamate deacylase